MTLNEWNAALVGGVKDDQLKTAATLSCECGRAVAIAAGVVDLPNEAMCVSCGVGVQLTYGRVEIWFTTVDEPRAVDAVGQRDESR